MTKVVLIVGVGDLALRIAHGLGHLAEVSKIVLAGLSQGAGAHNASLVTVCTQTHTTFMHLDATDLKEVERVIKYVRPDLIIQAATLFNPYLLSKRRDAVALALKDSGAALQLPRQLPIIVTLMTAVRGIAPATPVFNLSLPDLTHPILDRLGLAPTAGLGNVTMYWMRARVAYQARSGSSDPGRLETIRVLGHHNNGYAVFAGEPPVETERRCHVYVGDRGQRVDALAYDGPKLSHGSELNLPTAAAALCALRAFLYDGDVSISVPGPLGLPGGYPVRIGSGRIQLDLPEQCVLDDAIAFNEAASRRDGLAAILDDGTAIFTDKAQRRMANIAPVLAEPMNPGQALERNRVLMEVLSA